MRRRLFLASTAVLLAGCLDADSPPETAADETVATGTGDGTPVAPLVNFAFELDADRSVATVRHRSGEPIGRDRTDRLELVLTTAPDHPIPSDVTLTPTKTPQVVRRTWREAGGDYPIAPGDSVRFADATPGDTLEVWWYGADHHRAGTRLEAATFAKE